MNKLFTHSQLYDVVNRGNNVVYCHRIASYFIKAVDFIPYFWNEVDGEKKSDDYKLYSFQNTNLQKITMSVFNSGVFYYFWHVYGDGYHCGKAAIENFRCSFPMDDVICRKLLKVSEELTKDYKANSNRRETTYKATGRVAYDEFFPKKSKTLIDKIDTILAQHYGFTDEELDFIINYNIKYRMGKELNNMGDE